MENTTIGRQPAHNFSFNDGDYDAFGGDSRASNASEATIDGGEAALDLFNEHLTESVYRPAHRGVEKEPVNWFVKNQGFDSSKESHYIAKKQEFQAGGYEITLTKQSLSEIAKLTDCSRRTGKREEGEERSETTLEISQKRSKRKIRYLIKSMGLDGLLTLTKRENGDDGYWTVDEWQKAFDRFRRGLIKAGYRVDYVAVLEKHKKGNYHLHAAIKGEPHVNIMRGLWYACCGGRGMGNVDMQRRRNDPPHKRRAGVAKYVSKYITKQANLVEFNKKRYWSTRHKLPSVKRYVLNSDRLLESLVELADFLNLDMAAVYRGGFKFNLAETRRSPGGEGFWFSFDEGMLAEPPF